MAASGVIFDDGTSRVQSRSWALSGGATITKDSNGRPVINTSGSTPGSHTLGFHSDVANSVSTTMVDKDVLIYNFSGAEWTNRPLQAADVTGATDGERTFDSTGLYTFKGALAVVGNVIVGSSTTGAVKSLSIQSYEDDAYLYLDSGYDDVAGEQSLVFFRHGTTEYWQLGKDTDHSFFLYDSIATQEVLAIESNGEMTLSPAGFIDVVGTLTAAVDTGAFVMSIDGTITEAASGTHPLLAGLYLNIPTVTGDAAAVTDTATLYIEGAMTATVTGNNWALWVDAGNVLIDENLSVDGDILTDSIKEFTAAAGITLGHVLKTIASVAGGAGLNIPHGTAPTTPADGDMWTTTAGLYIQINGSTVGPLS